jgi:hypothetical protein
MKIWSTLHSDMGKIVNYNGQPAVAKPGCMLEHPSISHYSDTVSVTSDNVTSGDNQQETVSGLPEVGSSETARQAPPSERVKIQSDLHGDMQSQAEMTWPPSQLRLIG